MDDLYAINVAKSEFRECFNLADTSRVPAIADPDLVNFSDGQPSEIGESGLNALKTRLANLFERFTAKLVVIALETHRPRFRGSCDLTRVENFGNLLVALDSYSKYRIPFRVSKPPRNRRTSKCVQTQQQDLRSPKRTGRPDGVRYFNLIDRRLPV
jgi:hypothetical protein